MIWMLLKTGFSWCLENWRIVLAAAVFFIIASLLVYVRFVFADRERLKSDLASIEVQIERNKKQAQALLTQREQENADLAEKWRQYARKSDDDYEAKIASLRASGSSGLRIYTGCGNGSSTAGQAATGSPEAPAKPAAESRTGDEVGGVILGAQEIGQVLQWYAYGQSCYAFVNGK